LLFVDERRRFESRGRRSHGGSSWGGLRLRNRNLPFRR
jgi:hypothetical protein